MIEDPEGRIESLCALAAGNGTVDRYLAGVPSAWQLHAFTGETLRTPYGQSQRRPLPRPRKAPSP